MIKSTRLKAVYRNAGELALKNGNTIVWGQLSSEAPPSIPYGTEMEILLNYEGRDYLCGTAGIVWATYDLRQAETVCSALGALNISCKITEESLDSAPFFLLAVYDPEDTEAAVDFIWRAKDGLCLQPDWWYAAGEENASFKKWLSGP